MDETPDLVGSDIADQNPSMPIQLFPRDGGCIFCQTYTVFGVA